jgi:hypothetical protein
MLYNVQQGLEKYNRGKYNPGYVCPPVGCVVCHDQY